MVCFSSDLISYLESLNTEKNRDCTTRIPDNGCTPTTLIEANEKTATFEELILMINGLFKQTEKSRILITNHYLTDMKAAELLEKLNGLQVQTKSIVPYLNMDHNPWNNLKRRESNSSESSLSTDITDFSTMSTSTSCSSLVTTNTIVDSHYSDIDDCTSTPGTGIQVTDASFERVIQSSADLMMIKTQLCQLLNIDLSHLMQLAHTRRTKQVYQTLSDLIKVCMDTEMKLDALQQQPAFIRIAYDTASRVVQASKEAFAKKLTACHEKDDFKGEDLHELSFSVNEASDLVSYYLQLQQGNTTVTDQILDVHFRMIKFCYDRVEFAFQQVDSLRQMIQEGIQQLNAVQTCQQDAVLDLMFKVQDIFSSVHTCVLEKVQPLVSNFTSSLKNDLDNPHSVTHGLIQHLVDLIFKDLDAFKSKFYSTICKLQSTDAQASFKEKVEASIAYLHTLNTDICNYVMMEALWSVDTTSKQTTSMQAQLDDFQARHTEFILTTYNEICCHFTEYDHGLNYQKLGDHDLNQDHDLFIKLQAHIDRTGVLLNYGNQVLQQRRAASHFMKHAHLLQGHNKPLGEAAFLAFKKEFKAVKYPVVDIEGLYNLFYFYQQDVYFILSQIYVDAMNLCFTN